ncbi:MAG: thiamine pyrophosphate-dependent enzyme, partial [Nitrospira sp.]|nr:thiamine pyrophosphate-dependent enzyme [Nitrospira sp.]
VGRCLQEEDYVFSNHRCHGHFLGYGGALEGLIAEIMGKASGVCGGRGGSQHLCQDRFFSNGIQGGISPVAAGLALSQKLEKSQGIVVVFLGDGTLGEGVLYETMNIASRWELPLLFVLENNLYSQSTSQQQTLAGGIEARFRAFGIETSRSDTWNWETLLQDMEVSLNFVRTSRKPRFHQVDTYRLKAHSKGDDDRDINEVESYWRRDPLTQILEVYGDKEPIKSMLQEIRQQVDTAIHHAEAAPFAEVSPAARTSIDSVHWQEKAFERERVVISIRRALAEALANDDRVILIGEDIEAPYGGAFKVTMDLSDCYPGRVRNTPLSEAAIVGIGNGLALAGFIPVVEIMFGDFLTLAADQIINHAAKFYWMYHEQVTVPLIIRTP